jgi:hydrogenase nickel incorporation protein HypA/HybF
MHELSITRNVVAIVADRAAGRRVTRVRLQVGRLSAVMPEAIRFCFDICAADTLLAGACLEIDEIQGRGRCAGCRTEVGLSAPSGRCPACGSAGLELIAGLELNIKEMEVESCA